MASLASLSFRSSSYCDVCGNNLELVLVDDEKIMDFDFLAGLPADLDTDGACNASCGRFSTRIRSEELSGCAAFEFYQSFPEWLSSRSPAQTYPGRFGIQLAHLAADDQEVLPG